MPYIANEWEPDEKAYELFLCHIHALERQQYDEECALDQTNEEDEAE